MDGCFMSVVNPKIIPANLPSVVYCLYFKKNYVQNVSVLPFNECSKQYDRRYMHKSNQLKEKGLQRIAIISMFVIILCFFISSPEIRVISKLPNSEQSYKGKVKTHKYINRQNQSNDIVMYTCYMKYVIHLVHSKRQRTTLT
jgi:hypothetical protein